MKINDVLEHSKAYLDKDDRQLIAKAFKFAEIAHKGQKRGTGEEYIQHPLFVADFLVDYKMDADTIAAALLHDAMEDNPQISPELEKNFSADIINLIDGVTKLGKIKIKKSWFLPLRFLQSQQEKQLGFERHVESLRKMFMAMSKDIRIIIIKLADRLHNMQTLDGVRPDKRERIARETLEIYAPLARRLGMGRLKGLLEDLAFPYAYPEEYKALKKMVGPKYEAKEKYISKAKYLVSEEIKKNKIKIIAIDGRRKHLYSLWKKLSRYDEDLGKIHDLMALRIIVPTQADCYRVLGVIHNHWRPLIGRIKDYIALPKPNGYQSLHTTVFGPEGEILEIQIRTKEMHEQAEFGIASHWHYSESKGGKDYKARKSAKITKNEAQWLNELARWHEKTKDSKEWVESVSMDFFQGRIFAFTPLGDVIDLPVGATPIDFAYAVHTDVGDSCVGAKVNGKIVPLKYNLKNGDIVEIATNKNSRPKRDWLRFVKTGRAKGKINSRLQNN